MAAGIDRARLRRISYGRTQLFVLGHDESAWNWNRRAPFVVEERDTGRRGGRARSRR